MKQATLARDIGIHPDRLAGYEHGRNPVPYWVADRISSATYVCQRWLYCGKLPMLPTIPVDKVVASIVPKSARFSAVYEALLSEEIDRRIADFARIAGTREEEVEAVSFDFSTDVWAPSSEHFMGALRCLLDGIKLKAYTLDEAGLHKLYRQIDRVAKGTKASNRSGKILRTWKETAEDERKILAEELKSRLLKAGIPDK
jgi:hypothetical protein